MDWVSAATGLVGTLIGGGIGVASVLTVERRRAAADRHARLEAELRRYGAELAGSSRSLLHVAGRGGELLDEHERRARFEEGLARIREAAEQIRIVGSRNVQMTARIVRRRAWEVRQTFQDRNFEAFLIERAAMNSALRDFYIALREQLGQPNANDVINDEDGYTGSQQVTPTK